MLGFDSAQDVTNILPQAKANRVSWVGRYFSFNPNKNLTPSEAAAILATGLDIVSIWEAAGDRYTTFTEANGLREATAALQQAQTCNQPLNTAIYFAVDFDASMNQLIGGIIPYFRAVNEVLAGHYKVGVYGSGLVCSQLDLYKLVSYDFLAGAMGWQGSRAYTNPHIQQSVDVDPWGFGFPIDKDTSPDGDFGSWNSGIIVPQPTPLPIPQPPPIVDIHALVIMLQQTLKDQGYYKGQVDGDFGPQSYAAITLWRNKRS